VLSCQVFPARSRFMSQRSMCCKYSSFPLQSAGTSTSDLNFIPGSPGTPNSMSHPGLSERLPTTMSPEDVAVKDLNVGVHGFPHLDRRSPERRRGDAFFAISAKPAFAPPQSDATAPTAELSASSSIA